MRWLWGNQLSIRQSYMISMWSVAGVLQNRNSSESCLYFHIRESLIWWCSVCEVWEAWEAGRDQTKLMNVRRGLVKNILFRSFVSWMVCFFCNWSLFTLWTYKICLPGLSFKCLPWAYSVSVECQLLFRGKLPTHANMYFFHNRIWITQLPPWEK